MAKWTSILQFAIIDSIEVDYHFTLAVIAGASNANCSYITHSKYDPLFLGHCPYLLLYRASPLSYIIPHFYMGQPLSASPMTFSIGGKQYVTIAAQTDVFTFGLLESEPSQ